MCWWGACFVSVLLTLLLPGSAPLLAVPVHGPAEKVQSSGEDFRFGKRKVHLSHFTIVWCPDLFHSHCPLHIVSASVHHDWNHSLRISPLPGNLSAKSVMGTIYSVWIKEKITCISMRFCYGQTQEWAWSPSLSILSLHQEKILFEEARPEALTLLSLRVCTNLQSGTYWQDRIGRVIPVCSYLHIFLLAGLSTQVDINRDFAGGAVSLASLLGPQGTSAKFLTK